MLTIRLVDLEQPSTIAAVVGNLGTEVRVQINFWATELIFDGSLRKHDILYVVSQFSEVRSTMTTWYGHYRRHRRVTSIIMYRYVCIQVCRRAESCAQFSIFKQNTHESARCSVQLQKHIYYIIYDDDATMVGTVRIRHAAARPKIGQRVRRNYRVLRRTKIRSKKKCDKLFHFLPAITFMRVRREKE